MNIEYIVIIKFFAIILSMTVSLVIHELGHAYFSYITGIKPEYFVLHKKSLFKKRFFFRVFGINCSFSIFGVNGFVLGNYNNIKASKLKSIISGAVKFEIVLLAIFLTIYLVNFPLNYFEEQKYITSYFYLFIYDFLFLLNASLFVNILSNFIFPYMFPNLKYSIGTDGYFFNKFQRIEGIVDFVSNECELERIISYKEGLPLEEQAKYVKYVIEKFNTFRKA